MKNLTIDLSKGCFQYVLPDGMSGEEFKNFKRDYFYVIEREVMKAKNEGKASIVINMENLPQLADDLKALKSFMDADLTNTFYTVQLWNQKREEAKGFFTAPCIQELDASGYIKKLVK
jgi:microsomal dipeptidase-like Zn-dependent dipeptidase